MHDSSNICVSVVSFPKVLLKVRRGITLAYGRLSGIKCFVMGMSEEIRLRVAAWVKTIGLGRVLKLMPFELLLQPDLDNVGVTGFACIPKGERVLQHNCGPCLVF